MKSSLRFLPLSLSALILLLCVSCGKSYSQYAVILWNDTPGPFANGSVAGVVAHSGVRQEYQLETETPQGTEVATFPAWRLEVFPSRGEAEAYSRNAGAWKDAFAASGRQALPVRDNPRTNGAMVYRLREGEKMKILGRQEEESNEGGLVSHWYEILTEGGTRGWVFGYAIVLDGQDAGKGAGEGERTILAGNWRPSSYSDMVESGTVDLDSFREDQGFFIDPVGGTMTLKSGSSAFTQSFTGLEPAGRNAWKAGKGVQLQLSGNDELVVTWSGTGKALASETFKNLPVKVADVRGTEEARRAGILAGLAGEKGHAYRSDNFGTLTISPDGTFRWEGWSGLHQVIPPDAGNAGVVRFDCFLTKSLASRYSGVITLEFLAGQRHYPVRFLYQDRSDGLRFEYVRDSQFRGAVLTSTQANGPLVFFYR